MSETPKIPAPESKEPVDVSIDDIFYKPGEKTPDQVADEARAENIAGLANRPPMIKFDEVKNVVTGTKTMEFAEDDSAVEKKGVDLESARLALITNWPELKPHVGDNGRIYSKCTI